MLKNSMRSPRQSYTYARSMILFALIMTLVNCLLYAVGGDSYFVFSILLAYYVFELDLISILLALVILLPYFLAWLLSKRKPGWMIVALVLFSLDTLFVLAFFLLLMDYSMLIDLVIHIVGVVILALGVKHRKLGVLSDEEMAEKSAAAAQSETSYGDGHSSVPLGVEVDCTVSLAEPGKQLVSGSSGLIRFEANQLVVGAKGMGAQVMLGMLASVKERARISYSEISQLSFQNKASSFLVLDLIDGRSIGLTFTRANRDKALEQFRSHGFRVPEVYD